MNKSDITRDYFMLEGALAKKGYDWWWHSFTAYNAQTNEPKTFYVEYFLCNPGCAKQQPVIVWNNPKLRMQGVRPSYVMVNVGFWGKEKAQVHRFFSWNQVTVERNRPMHLVADDCVCTETHIAGSVNVTREQAQQHPEWMSDAGQIRWDLQVDKQIAYHVGYGASKFFRKLNAFEMFWHAEGMKTQYSGWIELNGQRYNVIPEKSYGYADKNWGSDFTSPWVWLSSCNLVSKRTGKRLYNSVFEIGGGCPKVFGISLNRKLLGQFYYEGKNYEFNFSKFWTGSKTYFKCEETKTHFCWKVVQTTRTAKMTAEIFCDKKEMLWINYEAPNGTKRHNRLWNCGNGYGTVKLYVKAKTAGWNLVDEVMAKSVGCEYGEYDAPEQYNRK